MAPMENYQESGIIDELASPQFWHKTSFKLLCKLSNRASRDLTAFNITVGMDGSE